MDSVSQLVLGSSITLAAMGRRTAVWKAALWGGVAGTLPDLDALIDFGDAVSNMVRHRAESHGLFYLTLLAPLLAWGVSRLHGEPALFKRWCLALWLALFTHPLLDWFTIYGTQLLQPFSAAPLGLGSMFIIDPLYTLPLLIGVVWVLRRGHAALRWNLAALAFSCAYLAWSVVALAHVERVVREQLAREGRSSLPFFATPTPFNTVLWRIVVNEGDHYHEGYWGFFDRERRIHFDAFPSESRLRRELVGNGGYQRMAAFSRGFYKLEEKEGKAVFSDLRMGQEPFYVFAFELAERSGGVNGAWQAITPVGVGGRVEPGKWLSWLATRITGEPLPPPR